MLFFHRLYVCLRYWLLAFCLRVRGIWMHWGIMWEVVMYQSRFNLMEEPILAGVVKSQPKFWLMIFARLCFIVVAGKLLLFFFFCLKFQTSGWSFSVTGLNTSCSVNKPKWVRFEPQKWRLGRGFCFCDFESSYEMFQQQEDYGAKELSESAFWVKRTSYISSGQIIATSHEFSPKMFLFFCFKGKFPYFREIWVGEIL